MPTPDDLEREHTLTTAVVRYNELRGRDAFATTAAEMADEGQPAEVAPLTREESLELLALGEVVVRKAGYGRQLGVRSSRAAGASWAQIGAALGMTKQAGPAGGCDQPWLLPRSSEDSPLVRAAAAMPDRLADHGWTVSTGPLVWNRLRDRLSRRPRKGSVKVLWAADMDGGVLRRHRRRDEHRYLQLRTKRERRVFVLDRPAVLIQRTTSPEQRRRLVAAALDVEALTAWGGEVVVENHVNVLTCCDPNSALSTKLLVRLLDSEVLDRLYRCVTGSVAVSAYELGALPLPAAEVLASWAGLDDDALDEAIAEAYGQRA